MSDRSCGDQRARFPDLSPIGSIHLGGRRLLQFRFLAVIWRVGVFHVNLKLLLANFNLVLYAYGVGFLYKSLSMLITVWNGRVCSFSMMSYDCKVSELVVSISNACVNYASLAVCFERLYCTIRYERYEKSGGIKPWVGVFLILICYTCTFGHQLGFLSNIARDRPVAFCENLLSMTSEMATTSLTIVLSCEAANVILSMTIFSYNKYQLRRANRIGGENLGSRFQLDQNVKVNRLLAPAMILEAICYLPTFTFLILLARGIDMSLETRIFWIHVTYNFKLLFAFLQPILGFVLNPQLKRSFRDAYPRLTACLNRNATNQVAPIVGLDQSMNPAEAACRHFDMAARHWAIGPKG